jgi:hypothetical protein
MSDETIRERQRRLEARVARLKQLVRRGILKLPQSKAEMRQQIEALTEGVRVTRLPDGVAWGARGRTIDE